MATIIPFPTRKTTSSPLNVGTMTVLREHHTSIESLKRRLLADLTVPKPVRELTVWASKKRVEIALHQLRSEGLVQVACTMPNLDGVWEQYWGRRHGGGA